MKTGLPMSGFVATSSSSPAPSESSAHPSADQFGEVQAILAERTSTTLGCNEVLVVWQPEWIPITNVQDGPILIKHHNARKCRFISAVGKVLLPVEPDTTLANDIAAADAWTEKQLELHRAGVKHSGSEGSAQRGTPRKSLGSVAKRAAPSASSANVSKK
jgi:hypothetical protein